MEEYMGIFASPMRVPLHCQVKHSIDLTPSTLLPNIPIYRRSIVENDETKRKIQELLQKGHIKPSSSPYGSLFIKLKGAKYFNKIDLKSSYHRLPIKPSDVCKIAFKLKEGLFEWLLMPFGLTNAPATFIRLMDEILRPFTNAFMVVYLNDIFIFSHSWEDHLHHIRQVLQTL
eukprot:PITA_12562